MEYATVCHPKKLTPAIAPRKEGRCLPYILESEGVQLTKMSVRPRGKLGDDPATWRVAKIRPDISPEANGPQAETTERTRVRSATEENAIDDCLKSQIT